MLIAVLIAGDLTLAGLPLRADIKDAPATPSTLTVQARVDVALGEKRVTDQLQDMANLAATLSLADIPEALRIASGLKPLRERMVLEYATLRRWSELAPKEAFAAIAQMPEGREKVQTLRVAADRFAQKDAPAAAAAALALLPGKASQAATDAVAAAWAKRDGIKALAWAKALPEGRQETALYALRFAWVHVDPVAASADVVTLPPGNTKNALMANIAEEWTTLDPKAAMQWAQNLPDGPEKEIVMSNTARTLADKEPMAAIQFALTLSPPQLRQNAVTAVVTNWTTQQPKAAGDWAVTQTDPSLQRSALQAVVSFWTVVDPAGAGEWVKSIQSQSAQDTAIGYYVQAVAAWAPELGAKLIAQSAPQAARQPGALDCAKQWLTLDPVAAQKWINASSLPPEVKTQWLASLSVK